MSLFRGEIDSIMQSTSLELIDDSSNKRVVYHHVMSLNFLVHSSAQSQTMREGIIRSV
jgi:hypothetical protein